jgi:hypothetical protein
MIFFQKVDNFNIYKTFHQIVLKKVYLGHHPSILPRQVMAFVFNIHFMLNFKHVLFK